MRLKIIVSGFLAGIIYFLLGIFIYGVLFNDRSVIMDGTAVGVVKARTDIVWWALIVGSLAFGIAYAFVLGYWYNVTTFRSGAKAAAMFAFLFELGYDLSWFSGSNLMSYKGLATDIIVTTLMSAIAGGIIGMYLGRNSRNKFESYIQGRDNPLFNIKNNLKIHTKVLIAAAMGAISSLIMAFFLYDLLFGGIMSSFMGSAQNMTRPLSEMKWWAWIFGNYATSYLVAGIYYEWAGIKNFSTGASAGALIGLLFTIAYDMIDFATTNIMTLNAAILEIILSIVVWTIMGGIVGWWLGKGNIE